MLEVIHTLCEEFYYTFCHDQFYALGNPSNKLQFGFLNIAI